MASVEVTGSGLHHSEGHMTGVDTSAAGPHPPSTPLKERRESYESTAGHSSSYQSHHDGGSSSGGGGGGSSNSSSVWQGFTFAIEPTAPSSSAAAAAAAAAVTDSSSMHQFFGLQTTAPTGTATSSLPSASFSPHSAWPTHDTSGECTPTAGFDGMADYHAAAAAAAARTVNYAQPPHSAPAGFDITMSNSAHPMSSAGFPSASPQSRDGGWFGSQTDGVDFQSMPTPTALGQALVSSTSIMRRDGIRKKNARFEIPAERNLRTIDHLINQSTDEREIKELKQQKRLLRNRQAALDSRQRKKQHTERLEEEKKHYTAIIADLEEGITEVKHQEREFLRQKEQWAVAEQQYRSFIDRLVMEKEELLRRHTIEGAELRKKNALLVEQLQRFESTAMSTATSSTGFSTEYSEFDQLGMNTWDDFSLPNDFSLEADPRAEMAMPVAPKKETRRAVVQAAPADEKSVTSGFLLMLLLCGAWVVSNSSKSAKDLLPSVPDEMKTASAAVLDSLYKDSGISLQDTAGLGGHTPRASSGIAGYEMASLSQSSLEVLHRRLVTPNEQQLQEQAFSLTPRQYNDLSAGMGAYPPSSLGFPAVSPVGPSVGEALATEPPNAHGSAAEGYTRSLLKGRVSSQVLKDFARMVSTTRAPGALSWKAEPVD